MTHGAECGCVDCLFGSDDHVQGSETSERVLRLTLPVPLSKKNNMIVRKKRSKAGKLYGYPTPSDECVQQHELIRRSVAESLAGVVPFFADHEDVDMTITWSAGDDMLEVELRPLERVTDNLGKDLANMTDTICDALQGAAYKDDRQVARITMRKQQ